MKMNAPNEGDRAVPCSMVKLGGEAAHYWHRPRSGRSTLRVFAFVLLLGIDARGEEQPLAQSTIALYNKTAPDSVELANFYAQQRGIAPDHLVGLTCSTEEEISREEYDKTIADPLREIFKQRHWWTLSELPGQTPSVTASAIHFVAVIEGVPLKIRSTTDYPGDQSRPGPTGSRNEASVDSELAARSLFTSDFGADPEPIFPKFPRHQRFRESKINARLPPRRADCHDRAKHGYRRDCNGEEGTLGTRLCR
jgi:hypothetical protein